MKDGTIDWPLVLQLTCRIIPLVDTLWRPEEGIILPSGKIIYPENRFSCRRWTRPENSARAKRRIIQARTGQLRGREERTCAALCRGLLPELHRRVSS